METIKNSVEGYKLGYETAKTELISKLKHWFNSSSYFVHPEDDNMINATIDYLSS